MMKIHYPPGYDAKALRAMNHHYLYPLDLITRLSVVAGWRERKFVWWNVIPRLFDLADVLAAPSLCTEV